MFKFTYRRLSTIVVFLVALVCMGLATACTPNTDLALLDDVSTLVVEQHYDANLHGLDWTKIRAKYQSLVLASDSHQESLSLIDEMLQELGDSHCGFGNLNSIQSASSPYLFGEASVGLDIRLVNSQAVITTVDEGSPAASAGIRPGFVLEAVDGREIQNVMATKPLRPPSTVANKMFHQTEAVLWLLYGPPETPVTIDYLDEKNKRHSATLVRHERRAGIELSPSLPPIHIEHEARGIADGINYLQFNAFQPDEPANVLAAIERFDQMKPLIIDLRGNNGGSVNATSQILSHLAGHRFLAYNRVSRHDATAAYIEPTGAGYRGAIAVMVDEMSISAAENFAAIVQHTGLGQVVGARTPGQLLWGEAYPLDNDHMAVIPVARMIYPDGTNIEGRGVEPDLIVELRREDLLLGVDTQLQAAISRLSNTR